MKTITLYNFNELSDNQKTMAIEDVKNLNWTHFKDDAILSMLDISKFKEVAEFNYYVTLDSRVYVSRLYFKDLQDMFEKFYSEKCDYLFEDTIHVFRDMLSFINFKIYFGEFHSRDLESLKHYTDYSILDYIKDEQNFFETITKLFSSFNSYNEIERYLVNTLYDFKNYLTNYLNKFEEYINQTLKDNGYIYENNEIFFFEDGTVCPYE